MYRCRDNIWSKAEGFWSNLPVSPFVTTLQLTTLGSTAVRSSRKKTPFERFLSYQKLHKVPNDLSHVSCIYSYYKDKALSTTLKLSIRDVLPELFTLLFAQLRMSLSVISFPREWDLKFFRSRSMVNLINCHRKAEGEKVNNISLPLTLLLKV